MPANMVLIEKISVGAAGASSVTFSGIPQTGYTDLVVKMSTRTSASSITGRVYVAFNGVGTNQTRRLLLGNGSSASSGSANDIATDRGTGNSATASTFSNMEMYIPNYTSANNKSVSIDAVGENNATEAYAGLIAGLWSSTAAITEMTLSSSDGGNFVQGTTFYLYGVAKLGTTPVIVPYATGGDTIMTDGTYWYHAFLSSGTFTPQKAITCDYLVVAGGGGGGTAAGGGGGAGGLRSTVTATGGGGSLETALSLGTSAYTVTIGAGGTQSSTYGISGTNGSNSVFATITSTGGGGGAGYNNLSASGGSGGGGTAGGVVSAPRYAGAAGTANQGRAGGNGSTTPDNASGGGGGAGTAGTNSTGLGGAGGPGGAGVAVSITGSSVTYAGGGGGAGAATGGAGGSGGGGNGGFAGAGAPTRGTPNSGGGGGGDWNTVSTAGAGGSGIVIIRYAV